MCTTNKIMIKDHKTKKKGKTEVVEADDYFELEKPEENEEDSTSDKEEKQSRVLEKVVFVLTSITVILLTHTLTWAHWLLPFIYVMCTPILIIIRAIYYWKLSWQFFMIDFCYFANAVTMVYLCLFPENENLFRAVFALTNGPVLVAVAVYRNSLVYHNHDKITSCYIHFLPALLTFSIRWFPESTAKFWYQSFISEAPSIDVIWSYVVPFAFFFLHSTLYFLIVNVLVKPTEPHVTSYSYLADKYDKLNCIGGPWGQGIAFYGLNWLFCLTAMLPALIAYNYFPVHCAFLAVVFLVALWNGGSYYAHVFSKRGFTVE